MNRQERRGFSLGETHHVARESVHYAIHCLVRHGLAFVAAPAQDHEVLRLSCEIISELTHERALAHAGFTLHQKRQGFSGARLCECLVESGELLCTTHKIWSLCMGRWS